MEFCLDCNQDCSWGSIGFIDRYSRFIMNDKDEYIEEGYVCGQCANEINEFMEGEENEKTYN